jgi:uncharacterized protein (TIGR02599 family)
MLKATDMTGSRTKKRPLITASIRQAFTLVEVMVSMVVLAIMMMLIAQIIGTTQRSWRSASSRLSQFREARIAFDTITRNLRQATLNAYRDFHYSATDSNVPASNSPNETPDGYRRVSELAFVSGQATDLVKGGGIVASSLSGHSVFFQAPLGVTDPDTSPKEGGRPKYENLKHLLCGRGYFVQFGDDADYLPAGLKSRLTVTSRFRLMEYQPPAEKNTIYDSSDTWFNIDPAYLRPVSDKIVGLILSPRLASGDESITVGGASLKPTSIAPDYSFDSRKKDGTGSAQGRQHLLPPVVKVTMVALDDASMDQLAKGRNPKVSLDEINGAMGKFKSAAGYESDIDNLKGILSSGKVNYRIFEATVVIPASRWAL